MEDKIFGRNPVLEAIRSGREIDKIFVKKGNVEGSLIPLIRKAKERGIIISEIDRHKLDQMADGANHQGVIAIAATHEYMPLAELLDRAKTPSFLVICDKITDPHNLGSILRTANCVGADGVIIPKRNSVGLNSVVAKTSAGAIEYTPVAHVTNIAQTIDQLKERGYWIAGADMDGEEMYKSNLTGAIALVIGSEGEGISRLVREKCDFLVKIPMSGDINSLNASAAAAVLMYEIKRQRIFADSSFAGEN